MAIAIAKTRYELQRSNRRVASENERLGKVRGSKGRISGRSCARTGIDAGEERAVAAPRDVGAGIRAPVPQRLASDRKPTVIAPMSLQSRATRGSKPPPN
jgi:hypothetical protein